MNNIILDIYISNDMSINIHIDINKILKSLPPHPMLPPWPLRATPACGGGVWGDINIHIDINMNIDIHIIIMNGQCWSPQVLLAAFSRTSFLY